MARKGTVEVGSVIEIPGLPAKSKVTWLDCGLSEQIENSAPSIYSRFMLGNEEAE
jgi:hypothetical protein